MKTSSEASDSNKKMKEGARCRFHHQGQDLHLLQNCLSRLSTWTGHQQIMTPFLRTSGRRYLLMWSILQVQQPEALVRVTDVMTVLYVINVIIELHNQDI